MACTDLIDCHHIGLVSHVVNEFQLGSELKRCCYLSFEVRTAYTDVSYKWRSAALRQGDRIIAVNGLEGEAMPFGRDLSFAPRRGFRA